jgi:hypothetical protein
MKNILLLLTLVFSFNSYAQEAYDNPYDKMAADEKFFVKTDLTAVLLRGFSLAVGRTLSLNSSVELDYRTYELDSDMVSSIDDYEHDFTAVALRWDYWFYRPIEQRGIFLAVALNSVKLESRIKPIFSTTVQELSDSQSGAQFILGYQLDYLVSSDNFMRAKFGLGYGNGAGVEFNLGGTHAEITTGLLLEGSVSYHF